jgi:hypothetical protein
MKPPDGPRGPDEVVSLLDEALRDILSDVPDPRLTVRARRLRASGLALLTLAAACICAIAVLSVAVHAVGTALLGCAAILALFGGGWSIDRASKEEMQAHRSTFAGALRDVLRDTEEVFIPAEIRRRRYFGISMLFLAGFCTCVAAVPIPGKQTPDTLMWSGFAVALIIVGTWQLRLAAKEALRAQEMSAAGHRRKAAKSGTHISRVD